MRPGPRRLYHFTSRHHLSSILSDRFLSTTDPNLHNPDEGRDPRVVWFVDLPDVPPNSHGLAGSAVDKTEVRITVEVTDARPWMAWVKVRPHHPVWIRTVIRTGGGIGRAAHWYVVMRDVPEAEWLAVEERQPDGTWKGVEAWTR